MYVSKSVRKQERDLSKKMGALIKAPFCFTFIYINKPASATITPKIYKKANTKP